MNQTKCSICQIEYITHLESGQIYKVLDWGYGWVEVCRMYDVHKVPMNSAFWRRWKPSDEIGSYIEKITKKHKKDKP